MFSLPDRTRFFVQWCDHNILIPVTLCCILGTVTGRQQPSVLPETVAVIAIILLVLIAIILYFKQKKILAHDYKKEAAELITERRNLYGEKNPDKEESRMETLILNTEKTEKRKNRSYETSKSLLNAMQVRITALKENIKTRKEKLDSLEFRFKTRLQKTDFEDEKVFIANKLPLDKRNILEQKAKKLDAKQVDLVSRKKDRKTRLNQEQKKKIIDQSLDVLKKEQIEVGKYLKTLGQEIGAAKQKLFDNKNAKQKLKEKTDLIDAQNKEYEKWNSLHFLIGSADGKKFRNFAQGLTFELMVSHANIQLEKMSDRYLLVRDQLKPLELNIVDNFQAGEIRSTKNLSGGESFIVSLALALGLSSMASNNVRVDSLFLDEGFGTLDEDALETSLDALAGLHQQGKLIGVISHVSALKLRIATQIKIIPLSGGKSKISGPGCNAA